MAQFRLTRQFAKDCGVCDLAEPVQTSSAFDDWVVDVMTVDKNKVAVIMHAKTLMTFLIPYQFFSGAKNVMKCFPVLLENFFHHRQAANSVKNVKQLFSQKSLLCQINNKMLSDHLALLKTFISDKSAHTSFETIDWDALMEQVNALPVSIEHFHQTSAHELMEEFFNENHLVNLH